MARAGQHVCIFKEGHTRSAVWEPAVEPAFSKRPDACTGKLPSPESASNDKVMDVCTSQLAMGQVCWCIGCKAMLWRAVCAQGKPTWRLCTAVLVAICSCSMVRGWQVLRAGPKDKGSGYVRSPWCVPGLLSRQGDVMWSLGSVVLGDMVP
jgi:hypothetical protein